MIPVSRALLVLALVVPTSAGTAGATHATATGRPSVALTASPAHLNLQGSRKTTVRISNTGTTRVVIDVRRAGFALDLRGRPRIVPDRRRTASSWLAIRPSTLVLRPGTSGLLSVSARLPRHVEPGDHDALVLLTTRPRPNAGLAVKMRLGVVVAIRAPGRVVHRLALRGLAVHATGRLRELELLVAKRGNVTEELASNRVLLRIRRGGQAIVTLRGEPRQLLPRTKGVVVFRYGGRARGLASAVVTLGQTSVTPTLQRTFRLRL
jgi:hypothetical protein